MDSKGKRGQAYNLNLAGSDILAPDVVSGRHISPKCYTRPLCAHHICGSFYSSLKLKCPPSPFLSLKKSPNACLTRIRRALTAYGGTDLCLRTLRLNLHLRHPC